MSVGRQAVAIWSDEAYKITFNRLSSADLDAALTATSNASYRRIAGAFDVNGTTAAVAVRKEHVLASVQIDKLSIKTHFQAFGIVLAPVFKPVVVGGADQAIVTTCNWTAPSDMLLYLAVKAVPRPDGKYKVDESYLFACSKAYQDGFYRLPLSNVYTDGRICLGNSWAYSGPSVQGCLQAALKQLTESPWNSDLLPEAAKVRKIFTFDPVTLASNPIEGDWRDGCHRVSRVEMEALYPQQEGEGNG